MRDDSRPTDAFAWTRPWVPYGDDPFVWYDPSEDMKPREPAPAPASDGRDAPRRAAEVAAPSPSTAASHAERPAGRDGEEEVWVELPPAEDKPKRSRRSRGRGRGGAGAADEAVAEAPAPVPAPEPAPEAAPEPDPALATPPPSDKKPRASRAKKPVVVEAVVEARAAVEPPAPEPVRTAVTREPDPAEISAPPAAPRRGWWRRG